MRTQDRELVGAERQRQLAAGAERDGRTVQMADELLELGGRPVRAGQLQQATASNMVSGGGRGGDSLMKDVRGRTTSMLTHIMTPCVNWRAHAFIERSIWCFSTPSFATLSR